MLPRWLRTNPDKRGRVFAGLVEQITDGGYVRRKSGHIIYVNEALCRLSGYKRSELTDLHVSKLFVIPPTEFQRIFDTSNNTYFLHGEQKLKHKSGELLAVEVTTRAISKDWISGIVHDLSEHAELEARLRSTAQLFSLMETEINDVLFSLSVEPGEQYRFRYANDAFYRATGLVARQVISKLVHEVIPEPSLSMVLDKYRQAMRERRTVRWNETSEYPAGIKHGEISVTPVFSTQGECTELVGRVFDVTERKQHELALERQKNLYAMLSQTNQAIVHLHDREELFNAVCRIAVQNGQLQFAAITLLDKSDRQLRVAALYGLDSGYLQLAQIYADPSDTRGLGPLGEAVVNGQSVISNDFLNDPRTRARWQLARQAGIRAAAAFPIREAGQIIGALGLYANMPGYFVEDVLPTLDEMAADVSFALDNYVREAEREHLALEKDQIFKRVTDGFVALDRDWNLTYVNAAAGELLRGDPADLLARNFWSAVPREVADKLRQSFQISMVVQQPALLEEYFDSWKSWYVVHTYPSQDGLTVYFHNITDRRRAQEQERAHYAEVRQISQRLLEVQESERRNLARELHDEVGQCLSVINMKLRQADALTHDPTLKQLLDEVTVIVTELDTQVGQLSLDLHPSMLDDLGLQAAFQWCIRTRFGSDSQKIRLEIAAELPRFSADVETTVFRVFQECLSNALKYAAAIHIHVKLVREEETLRLTISDNGRGFDVAAAMQSARAGKSLGLLGMQERARFAGGEISIHSEPGSGTTVQLSLPATRP